MHNSGAFALRGGEGVSEITQRGRPCEVFGPCWLVGWNRCVKRSLHLFFMGEGKPLTPAFP
jgi:hypothetical protein